MLCAVTLTVWGLAWERASVFSQNSPSGQAQRQETGLGDLRIYKPIWDSPSERLFPRLQDPHCPRGPSVNRLVHWAAFPSRLDVQANFSHSRNVEVNGILPTLAGWGGETAASGSGWRMGGPSTPEYSAAASAWSLAVRMLSTQGDWEWEIS